MNSTNITPYEAELYYQHYRRMTTKHAANCQECDILAWKGEMCNEAQDIWNKRRYYLALTILNEGVTPCITATPAKA